MIRLRIKIKSQNGEAYTNDELLEDDYIVSKQNLEFNNLIEKNIATSHIKEIDSVKSYCLFRRDLNHLYF